MRKKLRCYFSFHRWEPVHVVNGKSYMQCRDCGKVRLPEDTPPLLAGPGPAVRDHPPAGSAFRDDARCDPAAVRLAQRGAHPPDQAVADGCSRSPKKAGDGSNHERPRSGGPKKRHQRATKKTIKKHVARGAANSLDNASPTQRSNWDPQDRDW